MHKNPEFDLKFQYRRVLETSAIASLSLIILMMVIFKKFETDITLRALEAPPIEVEDIPITRTVKKIEVPRKPTIPVEDPDIDPADDIDIPDVDFFDPSIAPPPPPPAIEEEIVPFFKVENPPQLVGGQQRIANYIIKHNLFPKMASEAGVSGKVLIGFVVDKEGKTKNVKIIQEKPPGLGFGEAGVKVMKAMTFTPGMQRDKPVSVQMQQPIRFTYN
ncbi:MAG: energy transducer TonB [Candidatus Hatepunaea meridiana]|nr:energy transducer TonB [Candidatus Hatepunaea meridiana]